MLSPVCLWRVVGLALAGAMVLPLPAGGQSRRTPARRAAASPEPFKSPLTLEQMRNKQMVIETTAGTIVIALLPEAAPNHVGYVMKLAHEGASDGTTFHRAVKYGIVQGGDPLSKDPEKRALYGTGGLGVLAREPNPEKHTRGAVSAVLQPGRPDSAGAQFFICVADQPALDGQYTVFGRVVEGLDVVEQISASATDAEGKVVDRVEMRRVTIGDTPPPEPTPFATDTIEALATYRAVLETTLGDITIELFPDRAPNHVRNFLRLARTGVYDGMGFHRVVRGFAAQTGSLTTRAAPLTSRQRTYVTTLAPEFNDVRHVRGIVSMARGDDPASASTSFFICLAAAPSLDGKYTAFGRLVSGDDVLAAIESTPVDGELPRTPIGLTRVRVEQVRP